MSSLVYHAAGQEKAPAGIWGLTIMKLAFVSFPRMWCLLELPYLFVWFIPPPDWFAGTTRKGVVS